MAKQTEIVKIYNKSNQMLALHVRPPEGEFYSSEQQVRLNPGTEVTLPKDHINQCQIDNLQRNQMIKVVFDG